MHRKSTTYQMKRKVDELQNRKASIYAIRMRVQTAGIRKARDQEVRQLEEMTEFMRSLNPGGALPAGTVIQ